MKTRRTAEYYSRPGKICTPFHYMSAQVAIAVGTPVGPVPPGGRGRSPAPRLPQNVACRFPALRSSEVDSQRGDSLQLRVREIQLWSLQRKPLLDLLKLLPPDLPFPTPAAQHFAPVTFHGPMDPLQRPEVPGDAVVRIVTAEQPTWTDWGRPVPHSTTLRSRRALSAFQNYFASLK